MELSKSRCEKVLGRFNKKELPVVAAQLGLRVDIKTSSTKKAIISTLVERCIHGKVTPKDLLNVELQYLSNCPTSVSWKVYRVEFANLLSLPSSNVDPKVFFKRFQQLLGDSQSYTMAQAFYLCKYWLCIHIDDSCHAPYTCCILRLPPCPFLFLSGLRKPHLKTILSALTLALDSIGCEDMGLSGKNLDSLIDMALNQSSQGPLSSYRLNQVDPNPLLAVASKRSHHPSRAGKHLQEEAETKSEAKRCKTAAVDTFGTNSLPVLEKFTFNLNADLPDGSDVISCRIKLAGSNVIEGTKAAIAANCFSLPIPKVIKMMPSYASTSVTVEPGTT